MKNKNTTKTGFRLNKNGAVIEGIEKEAIKSVKYLGTMTKNNGNYYYYERKQGNLFIYLPD